MRFIELFAGIGGFRYGLEKASESSQYATEMRRSKERGNRASDKTGRDNILPRSHKTSNRNFQCVWANDIDKYACQIYRARYGTGELFEGDIRGVDPLSIPETDLLCGGFPCQSFSIAGKRRGFEDTRGTLFFEICRIARAKRIKYLFLENVKGLLNHGGGLTYQIIIATLDELGYDCQWQVLNSKDFGVPQNRERVFIIGHLRGECRLEVFPIRESCGEINELQGQQVGAITARRGNSKSDGDYIAKGNWTSQEIEVKYKHKTGKVKQGYSQTGTIFGINGISPTIDMANARIFDTNDGFRNFTPIEAERLQGFPDGWTSKGIDSNGKEVSISDNQRYKCLGNAVTTNVIQAIGRRLII